MKLDTRSFRLLLKLPALLVIAVLISCQGGNKPPIETIGIRPFKFVDKVSDTVFFTLISKMTGVNEIAMLDVNEKRLIVCDPDFKLKKLISRRGKGPGELVYPSACYAFNDLYYVRDGKEMKIFNSSGRYVNSISMPADYNVIRFTVSLDGTIYTNSRLGNNKPLCAIGTDGRNLFSFGDLYKLEGSRMQTSVGQARHLFSYGNDRIISIGNNYPSFEIYDLKGKLLNSQNIDDPIISEDYKNLLNKQSPDPLTTIDLFLDVFIYNDNIYFLSSLKKADGTAKYYLIVGEIKSDKLTIRQHFEIVSDDQEASWNDLYVPNNSEVIIYELNTMAFHYFKIKK